MKTEIPTYIHDGGLVEIEDNDIADYGDAVIGHRGQLGRGVIPRIIIHDFRE